MIRPPRTAVQKPSTWKLRSSLSASHEVSSSIRAFTTRVIRPSVRMNSGKVSSFTRLDQEVHQAEDQRDQDQRADLLARAVTGQGDLVEQPDGDGQGRPRWRSS